MARLVEGFLRLFWHFRSLEEERTYLRSRADGLEKENLRLLRESAEWRKFHPPGHFYSPVPSAAEIDEALGRLVKEPPFPGIDLDEAGQDALLDDFVRFYGELPFPEGRMPGARFYLRNDSYAYHDAIILFCMLRHLRPRRIIEVGSGFSSAAMLDLNEKVFSGGMKLTFIDPDMTRLRALLKADDAASVTMLESKVQDVPVEFFSETLGENDVLFLDSSHVSKIGSDVNHLFFRVLPALRPGVHVHIHDVTWNLEYPGEWFAEGRAWNELYLLRAFLMYNDSFRIVLHSGWLARRKEAFLKQRMPLCTVGGGGQLWLRRIN